MKNNQQNYRTPLTSEEQIAFSQHADNILELTDEALAGVQGGLGYGFGGGYGEGFGGGYGEGFGGGYGGGGLGLGLGVGLGLGLGGIL
jgi:hypothetical protein